MSLATELIDDREKLAGKRSNFDTWWQQVGMRVSPASAQFTTVDAMGAKRTERLFSGKPENDRNKFAAVLESLLTPHNQKWHELTVPDDSLEGDRDALVYLQRLNNLLFKARYRANSNFSGQRHEGYQGVGSYGNSCLFIDETLGDGARYKQLDLGSTHWSEDHQGRPDTLYRKITLEARHCAQKARAERWILPPAIEREATTGDKRKEFEFIHCVRPNEERVAGRPGPKGMKFSSWYVALESKQIVSSSGYRVWPFGIGRYAIAPKEIYGRGPAMQAWPSILTLNEQKKTILRAGQREVDPPLLLSEDGLLEPFSTKAGALNHGMVSDAGQPLAMPLKTGANVPLGVELMAIEIADMEEAFLVSVYKTIEDHPNMTATQVLQLAQHKATLLAPMAFRQHSEDFGPQIQREIDILAHDSRYAWIMTDMPDSLRERAEDAYKVEYRSPLMSAMRANDAIAILQTFEAMTAAVQIDPDASLVMDVPESLREVASVHGVPARLMRDAKMVEQLKALKRQQEMLSQVAQSAPGASQALLNTAKAQQLRGA